MIETLYGLFYLGVLALVVGCFGYLFVVRDQGRASGASGDESVPLSRAAAKKAEQLRMTADFVVRGRVCSVGDGYNLRQQRANH